MLCCMANPGTEALPLEKKLRAFLSASLRVYRVPEDEVRRVLAFVLGLDIPAISQQVMESLFQALAMRYDFSLNGILPKREAT